MVANLCWVGWQELLGMMVSVVVFYIYCRRDGRDFFCNGNVEKVCVVVVLFFQCEGQVGGYVIELGEYFVNVC
jgi:hypothetical protein